MVQMRSFNRWAASAAVSPTRDAMSDISGSSENASLVCRIRSPFSLIQFRRAFINWLTACHLRPILTPMGIIQNTIVGQLQKSELTDLHLVVASSNQGRPSEPRFHAGRAEFPRDGSAGSARSFSIWIRSDAFGYNSRSFSATALCEDQCN
jgi:hypothetical protein